MTDIPWQPTPEQMESMADSVIDSDADPIVPTVDESDKPDRESRRRSAIADLMDRRGLKGKEDWPQRPKKERKPTPPKRKGAFEKRLVEFYTFIGMSIMPFDKPCAFAVLNSAEKCAEALDNLAYENESVRRVLTTLLETSAWGQVAMAHAPILMAIGVHHVPAFQKIMVGMAGAATAEEAEKWLQNGNGVDNG